MSENGGSVSSEEKRSASGGKSYHIGDVGPNARIQQGENLTWIEAAKAIPDNEILIPQFRSLFEHISKDANLDEDTRSISTKKTEAVVKGLADAQESPRDLHYALIDAKNWFSNKATWVWGELSNILSSDAVQKTIGTITESGVRGAIKALIG
jgi:hypothetical protein